MDAHLQNSRRPASTVNVAPLFIPGYRGDRSARLYRLADLASAQPVVLYLHGGGFVSGSLDDADWTARQIAERAETAVLSLDYSLAPRRPFPAAPEDAYAALNWLPAHAAVLNLDARRLAVAGDDAGASIAASAVLIARDRNGPELAAQVLLGPMLDPSMTLLGDAERLRSDIKPQTCAQRYAQYLPRTQERLHPYASPLASRRLHGLPPTYLATAKCDVLHREAEQYAAALIAAGVPTQITRFDVKHEALPRHLPLLAEVSEFLHQRLRTTRHDTDHADVF